MPRFRVVAAAFFCLVSPVLLTAAPRPAQTSASAPEVAAAQLEALSGEFVNAGEPDLRYSLYVANGGLVIESDRLVPTPLAAISATDFAFAEPQTHVHFTVDASGHALSFVFSTQPETVYERTGPAVHHVFHDYRRSEVMIPMRDGVKLHAVILKPADITAPLPFLMQRTPYGVDDTRSGSDNDMVVKLIDEYPDNDPYPTMRGYQLMTNAEIFRGRYLSGFDKPTALAPGSIYEYKFSLHDVDHVFKAGHTVMVEIQSTWFPLYDRNPQTFVPNIMKAKPADYRPATITIYSGAEHDSALELPVIDVPEASR